MNGSGKVDHLAIPGRPRWVLACAAFVILLPAAAQAWIWPEHRDIAVAAVNNLPAGERKTLDAMWAEAQKLGGKQVCTGLVDPGAQPDQVKFGDWDKICVDFASFPALAADHSCSTDELWADVSREPWAVKVVWVASRTKSRLASAKDPAQTEDVWSLSHLAMQYVDPRYLTRAEGNNAHFLVPRFPVDQKETLETYLDRVLLPSADINATGLYTEYHMLALRLAALYHAAPPSERADLARRALVAEGVALHFLEDSFSSGHYSAIWGGPAWAKGTHDYYSTIGLTTMTWKGDLFASHGDAHMTEQDMKVAAVTVRRSLAQVASAAEGRMPLASRAISPAEKENRGAQLLQGGAPAATARRPGGAQRDHHGPPGQPRPGRRQGHHPPAPGPCRHGPVRRRHLRLHPRDGARRLRQLGQHAAPVRVRDRRPAGFRAGGVAHEEHGRTDVAAGRAGGGPGPARPRLLDLPGHREADRIPRFRGWAAGPRSSFPCGCRTTSCPSTSSSSHPS